MLFRTTVYIYTGVGYHAAAQPPVTFWFYTGPIIIAAMVYPECPPSWGDNVRRGDCWNHRRSVSYSGGVRDYIYGTIGMHACTAAKIDVIHEC